MSAASLRKLNPRASLSSAKPAIRAAKFLRRAAFRPPEIWSNAGAMGRKRRRKAAATVAARAETVPPKPQDVPAFISISALALAFVGIGLAIDSGADASFDAPKRLICLVLIGVAAAPLFFTIRQNWLPVPGDRVGRIVLGSFLLVSAINAFVSLLQAGRLYQPFELEAMGSRASTGAFVGNVGYLALSLALAAVACLALLLSPSRPAVRIASGFGLALFLVALLVNRNLTAISALVVGATLFLFARFGKRAVPYAAVVLLLVALAVAASP